MVQRLGSTQTRMGLIKVTHPNLMPKRNSTLDDQIDENLKKAYSDVLNEEVPDRLMQLLEQLKSQDKKTPSGDVS
ncbi:NepR family anti-sigma factor [Dinoroseobacter sp. S375]|uniref:NepR family anti-sigma factor n=1 Tax=Dinoroseobacter sp. S375 TaxID=3415136 RepID=UPI003C7C75B6